MKTQTGWTFLYMVRTRYPHLWTTRADIHYRKGIKLFRFLIAYPSADCCCSRSALSEIFCSPKLVLNQRMPSQLLRRNSLLRLVNQILLRRLHKLSVSSTEIHRTSVEIPLSTISHSSPAEPNRLCRSIRGHCQNKLNSLSIVIYCWRLLGQRSDCFFHNSLGVFSASSAFVVEPPKSMRSSPTISLIRDRSMIYR